MGLYKKINGVNYDKAMLEAADKSVKGNGDGRISVEDAKVLVKTMKDGGKITEIEFNTLDYIRENYKMTEAASKYIGDSLSENLKDKPSEPPKKTENKIKYLVIALCLIIVLLLIFLLAKSCSENDTNKDNITSGQKIVSGQKNEEKPAAKNKKVIADDKNLKNNTAVDKNYKNGYVVKKNDTLTKISRAVYGSYTLWENIYNANKDKIENPNRIYLGQVLTIPEKKDKPNGNTGK